MSTLDYFSQVYSDFNVYLYFPIPNFVMGLIVAMLFNLISLKFSYKFLVIGSILMINLLLVSMLIVSLVCKEYQTLGFSLTIGFCFFFGFFGLILQLSYSAMFNYFSRTTVSNYNIGVGMSGVFTTILRMVITAIYASLYQYKATEVSITPVIIFFSIAVCVNFIILILNILLFQRETYKRRIVTVQ